MLLRIDTKTYGARSAGLGALAIATLLTTLAGGVEAAPVSEQWAQNWRDDLRFLARELPKAHPDPFAKLSRADFEARIDELIEAAPAMAHEELVIGLARIVAALEDGHTRVTLPLSETAGFFLGHTRTPPPHVPDLILDDLPLRLVLLDDGLVVRSAAREYAAAVGARVLKIGDKTAAEAIESVSPIVHRDNRHQLDYQLPDYLVLTDVLAAADVIDRKDAVDFTLAPTAGEPFVVRFQPIAGNGPDWVEMTGRASATVPLSRQNNDRKFWYRFLEQDRAVYFQYNEVGDEDEETLAAFAERLFAFVDENPVDKLIVDLRRNRGGSNGLNRAILHGMIRSEKLRQPGSLFVITGGGTFSAAMMFSVDVARHTLPIFVGSPTGSSPNHFGDSRKIRLPRTGLTVRVSSLYWQYSDPRDRRSAIEPHLPVPTLLRDYRSGYDAPLETILRPGTPIGPDSAHAGTWRGRVMSFRWTFDFSVRLDHAGGSWTGTIDVPELGVAGMALEEVAVDGGKVRFVLPDPTPDSSRDYVFTGRTEGQRIYGRFTYDSRVRPFVLTLQ